MNRLGVSIYQHNTNSMHCEFGLEFQWFNEKKGEVQRWNPAMSTHWNRFPAEIVLPMFSFRWIQLRTLDEWSSSYNFFVLKSHEAGLNAGSLACMLYLKHLIPLIDFMNQISSLTQLLLLQASIREETGSFPSKTSEKLHTLDILSNEQ